MIRFIFACMAFVVLSLALTPVYFGIKGTKDELSQKQDVVAQNTDNSLSFEEIYKTASTAEEIIDPTLLNAIAPATGEEGINPPNEKDEMFSQEFSEGFAQGFSGMAPSALAE